MLLANAVQSPDALLQQIGVQRQVEQHQVATELEVAAFTADLGAHQNLGAAFGAGKIGGGAVAVDQVHVAMEHAAADAGIDPQILLQTDGRDILRADQQNLLAALALQELHQPLHAGVDGRPGQTGGLFLFVQQRAGADIGHFRLQVRVQGQGPQLAQLVIGLGQIQWVDIDFATGKARQ